MVLEVVEIQRVVVGLVTRVGQLAQRLGPAAQQLGTVQLQALDDVGHVLAGQLLLQQVQPRAARLPVLDLVAWTVLVAVPPQHFRFTVLLFK